MTSVSRSGVQDRSDRLIFFLKLLSWLIAVGALAVGLYGAGFFDQFTSKRALIFTLIIHAIPTVCLMLPVKFLRVSGVWFGVFLIAQYLLSQVVPGDARYYKTLPPNLDETINVVGDALPGIQGIQRITTDAMGFRVQPPVDYESKQGIRVFAIGGSTTEQIYLDDRSTWTYLFQEQLAGETGRPVEVINTGLAGVRARHHLVMLHRILDFAPDCVIFLMGFNDWNKQIKTHFGSDNFRRKEPNERHFRSSLFGRALRKASSYVSHTLIGQSEDDPDGPPLTEDKDVQTDEDGVRIEDGSYNSRQNDSLARADRRVLAFDAVTPAYAAQLEEIGASCHAAGVPCLFLTQSHGYSPVSSPEFRRHFWMTPTNEDYTLDLASMGGIADLYNQHLIRFARTQGHDLIDLAAAMPASFESFYDDTHFNTEGARRVAQVLTDEVMAGACGLTD